MDDLVARIDGGQPTNGTSAVDQGDWRQDIELEPLPDLHDILNQPVVNGVLVSFENEFAQALLPQIGGKLGSIRSRYRPYICEGEFTADAAYDAVCRYFLVRLCGHAEDVRIRVALSLDQNYQGITYQDLSKNDAVFFDFPWVATKDKLEMQHEGVRLLSEHPFMISYIDRYSRWLYERPGMGIYNIFGQISPLKYGIASRSEKCRALSEFPPLTYRSWAYLQFLYVMAKTHRLSSVDGSKYAMVTRRLEVDPRMVGLESIVAGMSAGSISFGFLMNQLRGQTIENGLDDLYVQIMSYQ